MSLLAILVYALLAMQTHAGPHQVAQANESAAASRFVQSFYEWYTPRALKGDAGMVALKARPAIFSPKLRSALEEDKEAALHAKHEIVALDFDPFLNSQEPNPHYSVGLVEHKGQSWLVSVYGSSLRVKSSEASVIAVVEKGKGGWRFTNFLYDKGQDLLKTLRELDASREARDNRVSPPGAP
jgi:hypothetical protein